MSGGTRGRKVIGVGFACVDQLVRWRSVGEPVAGNDVIQYDMQGGGMTATAMVAVARLGGRAEFWGAVGDGPMGRFLLDGLRRESVDISQVVRVSGSDGPVYLVCVDGATGERMFYRAMAVAGPEEPFGDVERLTEAGCLLVDGSCGQAAVRAARKARQLGVPVVGDVGSTQGAMGQLLPLIDYAIASQQCALGLGVGDDYQAACTMITDKGPDVAVITLGEKGLICFDGQRFISRQAFGVDVVDTTGAGDTFHGAFCVGLVRGFSLEVNLSFASAVAAISCTKLGGRAGIASVDQVVGFLRQHDPMFDDKELATLLSAAG